MTFCCVHVQTEDAISILEKKTTQTDTNASSKVCVHAPPNARHQMHDTPQIHATHPLLTQCIDVQTTDASIYDVMEEFKTMCIKEVLYLCVCVRVVESNACICVLTKQTNTANTNDQRAAAAFSEDKRVYERQKRRECDYTVNPTLSRMSADRPRQTEHDIAALCLSLVAHGWGLFIYRLRVV